MTRVVVLGVLCGLFWVGHSTHWSLFGASESHQGQPKEPAAPAAPVQTAAAQATNDDASRRRHSIVPRDLPVVEFPSAEAARKCGVETAEVTHQPMADVITANGIVGYDQTHFAQLSVRVPGIVWRVEKLLGDAVKRCDVLAIFDAADVGQAKADLLEAAVLCTLKTQTLKRLQSLENVVPVRDIREAEAAQEFSRTQRFNAMQKLVNLGFPIRLEDIESLSSDDLAKHLQLLGLPPSLTHETVSANLIPLVAPFDGVVTSCEIVRGEMADPSKPQYILANVERMWINLDVRQEDAAQLRIGQAISFVSDIGPAEVKGRLTWIGTEIDPRTRTIRSRAEVDNPILPNSAEQAVPQRLLQAGAFGTARILLKDNPAAVVVPDSALHWQWEIESQIVFVPADDQRRFVPRIVTKGLVQQGHVQILGGLSAGERVVSAGSRILSSELSELLQKQLGDNAQAIRGFDHADPRDGELE